MSENVCEAVACGEAESFTVTFTVDPLAVCGVPLMTFPERVRPAGRPVADHVYGGVPPAAARDAL